MLVNNSKQQALNLLKRNSQDACNYVGEQLLIINLWNPLNASSSLSHCSYCWNSAYGQSGSLTDIICPYCYGTGYENGVRQLAYCMGIISVDSQKTVRNKQRGMLEEDAFKLILPAPLYVYPNDLIVRVNGWTLTTNGLVPQYMQILSVADSVQNAYVKDGNRFLGEDNRMGCTASCRLYTQSHPLLQQLTFSPNKTIWDMLNDPLNPFIITPAERLDTRVQLMWGNIPAGTVDYMIGQTESPVYRGVPSLGL